VSSASTPQPVPVLIIDTDLGWWWDDATAIGLANVLRNQGLVDVAAITANVAVPATVAAIDAIDTAYGNADIPIGALRGDATEPVAPIVAALCDRLPHTVRSAADVPDAVEVLRRALRDRPDDSVTIVGIGAYTNLARLLQHDRDLVAAKVDRLVVMDGLFPAGGTALTNQELDADAAAIVVGEPGWPTPIAWVDGFVGIDTRVGSSLAEAVGPSHPMRIAYEALFGNGPPTDGNWDAPAVLYAAFGAGSWFTELGRGGAARLNEAGGLVWRVDDPYRHDDCYVHLADGAQDALNARIDELLVSR